MHPRHGIFVETRLRQLLKSDQVETKVIAPIPSFPIKFGPFKRYAKLDAVPKREMYNSVDVYHPRYTIIPKIGQNLTPKKMAESALPIIHEIINSGFDFDLIDAHYFFPDGVAAAIVAQELNKPLVITARGTDVNLFADYKKSGKKIKQAADQSDAIICVADSLRQKLISKGVEADKILVLRNGVDRNIFYPVNSSERAVLRKKIGIDNQTVLAVGNLTKIKGFDLLLDSLAKTAEINLIIIGEGEEKDNLMHQAKSLNLTNRVRFIYNISQSKLRDYYNAADILVLASIREGMPNVVLESIACGTPVVSTNVGGVSEVLTPECGIIIKKRDSAHIAEAIEKVLLGNYSREKIATIGGKNSWKETTQGQLEVFQMTKGKRNK
mgnify:CR=1 FL=1